MNTAPTAGGIDRNEDLDFLLNRLALGVVEGTARIWNLYAVTELLDPRKNDTNPPRYLIDRKIGTGCRPMPDSPPGNLNLPAVFSSGDCCIW